MIDLGCSLKRAREAKGMSINDLAQATHIMAQTLEDIENENFSRISAPIYGRGFVKLYCEAVGLEPKPFVDEFMDIYNGNRPATIRMRPCAGNRAANALSPASGAAVESPAEENAAANETSASAPADADASRSEPPPANEAAAASEPPAAESSLFDFHYRQNAAKLDASDAAKKPAAAIQADPRGPSRYAAPLPIDDDGASRFKIDIPPVFWRMLVVIGGALALLWITFAGVRALYRVSMNAPERNKTGETASPAEKPAPEAAEPKAATARTPRAIEPLYID